MPGNDLRQTLLFSATFPREVQRLAEDFLQRNFATLTVGRVGAATDTIVQKVHHSLRLSAHAHLQHHLSARFDGGGGPGKQREQVKTIFIR